jgi:hypothetical protein
LTDDRIVGQPDESGSVLRVPLGRVHEVKALLLGGRGSRVAFGSVVLALSPDANVQRVQAAHDGVD